MSNSQNLEKIDLIAPTTGKLFFEKKIDLEFCKPHLMPLKSVTLEAVERMQKEAHRQLQENSAKTASETQYQNI
ncbi:BBSome-interacting protein 1 [Condylostylus longicornis]|uniref:BBSome-interacting protein 1 n=1 Tax=Condylostylus longicornis TaxID=2530218 RepID=UPI00244E5718|nr:BBSome-interacting protein 1 [Condylostylus longicornis]